MNNQLGLKRMRVRQSLERGVLKLQFLTRGIILTQLLLYILGTFLLLVTSLYKIKTFGVHAISVQMSFEYR